MSKYVQLFIAFGISAAVHAGASMLVHRSLEDDGAWANFLGQALIIMIEDHVIDLGKSLGLRPSIFWKLLGFVWTVFILGATMQVYVGNVIAHGTWVHNRAQDWFSIGPKV